MRQHALRNLNFGGNLSLAFLLLLAFAVCFASIPARAQGGTWQVDAGHSIARLSLGAGSQSVDVGVAPVSGTVVFDSTDPADPAVHLNIKSQSSEISFKSERSAITSDGKLAVVGNLSVTRVERSVTMEPNEAYAGPVYGEPVRHTDSREVTLVFPVRSLPAAQNGTIQLSASTTIGREAFPQLLSALEPGNWPSVVVEDKNCTAPSTVGEDYSGAVCTGTPIETATNSAVAGYIGGGEGYHGSEPAVVPDGSRATIALNLKLTKLASTAPAASGAVASAGH
jgi:polyisoprenoid-binding protein YceI